MINGNASRCRRALILFLASKDSFEGIVSSHQRLFLCRDSVTKPEASERIRCGISRARLITLAPARHLGLIEHHTRYAEVVREFAYAAQAQMGGGAA